MKKVALMITALFMASIIAATVPAQSFAASVKEYISEVKVGMARKASDAAAALTGYKILSDERGNPVDLNKNAGGGWGSKGDKVVYLGYKTTTDRKEAVTDLALMNMKGGYSVQEYEALMEAQMKSQIIPFTDRFLVAIEEYRDNYNSENAGNRQRTQYIHDMLNKLTDDDCGGKGLGDLLLSETKYEIGDEAYISLSADEKLNHADILTILAQSNGQATLVLENLIARAADTGDEPWIERFTSITYDDLVESLDMLPSDAEAELARMYQDDSKKILDMWDTFREQLLDSDKADEIIDNIDEDRINRNNEIIENFDIVTASDEEIAEMVEAWVENEIEARDATNKISDYYLKEYLSDIEYGAGNLYDFFTQETAEVSANLEMLYPLVASLSDGQRAVLDFATLSDLLIVAATEPEKYSDAELDKLEVVSIYDGVDRDIYKKGGVALTSDALRKDAEKLAISDRGKTATGIISIVMAGLAVASVLALGATLLVKLISVRRIAQAQRAIEIIDMGCETMSNGINTFIKKGTEAVMNGAIKGSVYNNRFWELQQQRETLRVSSTAEKRALNEEIDRLAARSSVCNKLMIGLSVAVVIFTAVSVYLSYRDMVDYYKVEFTPIPHYMVEENDITAYNEKGERIVIKNQTAYYKAVECNRTSGDEFYNVLGTCADMNGDVGKQWLALYVQRSDAFAPILADSLLAVVGDSSVPAGYKTGIHLFGGSAAFNLNNELYDWNKDAPGVFVYFKTDSSTASNLEDANLSAVVFNEGEQKKIDYKSKIVITSTAENVPENYMLAIFADNVLVAKGDNKEVTYEVDKITDDTTFTTYIIDISGRIYTGAPSKVDFADVNNGFFGKIISFFKGLFNLLPTVVFGK